MESHLCNDGTHGRPHSMVENSRTDGRRDGLGQKPALFAAVERGEMAPVDELLRAGAPVPSVAKRTGVSIGAVCNKVGCVLDGHTWCCVRIAVEFPSVFKRLARMVAFQTF